MLLWKGFCTISYLKIKLTMEQSKKSQSQLGATNQRYLQLIQIKIRSFMLILVIFVINCNPISRAVAFVYPSMDESVDSLGYGASGGAHMSHENPWGSGMSHNDWFMLGGRSHAPQCVPIPKNLTLCNNIRYDKMRLPNLLDHDTLTEVVNQAASWVGLVGIKCHPDSQLFLCSLFSPVCLDRLIYPCRSTCMAVKAGCEKRMMSYGFAWPDMLNCDKFPLDNDLCIKPQAHMQPEGNSCDACEQSETFEGIMDNFCRADVVVRSKIVEKRRRGDGSMDLVLIKSKVYKAEKVRKRSVKDLRIILENGNTCDCPHFSTHLKKDVFLIMANLIDERWVTSFVMKKPKKSRDYRRALKKFRDNPCSKAVEFMTSETQKIISGKTDSKITSGNKRPFSSRQTRKQRNSRKRHRLSQQLRRSQQEKRSSRPVGNL